MNSLRQLSLPSRGEQSTDVLLWSPDSYSTSICFVSWRSQTDKFIRSTSSTKHRGLRFPASTSWELIDEYCKQDLRHPFSSVQPRPRTKLFFSGVSSETDDNPTWWRLLQGDTMNYHRSPRQPSTSVTVRWSHYADLVLYSSVLRGVIKTKGASVILSAAWRTSLASNLCSSSPHRDMRWALVLSTECLKLDTIVGS